MKPESISDVEWERPNELVWDAQINLAVYPSKAVVSIINDIEEGNLPVVLISPDYQVVKPSYKVYEAYLRCHFSRIPVRFAEKERVNANPSPVSEGL